jgi:hypothetical protein
VPAVPYIEILIIHKKYENKDRSQIKLDLLNYFKEFQILIKMFSILFVFFPDITFPVEEYHRK